MRKLALVLIAIGGLLSGSMVYEVPNKGGSAYQGERDRDRDGAIDRSSSVSVERP